MTIPSLTDVLRGVPPAVLWSTLVVVAAVAVLVAVAVVARRFVRRPASDTPSRGTGGFWLAFVVGTLVSMDTSYRFFGSELDITAVVERVALCFVLEHALLSCGWSMRAAVRRGDKPGPARVVSWLLCCMAGYMAVMEAGPLAGMARVILGPIMAVVMLHLALGVEIKIATGKSTGGTWLRIFEEFRERALSRIGLADDQRSAATRTRDRAADRAARLATGKWVIARRPRLARAVRLSGVAIDPVMRDRMLAQVAAYGALDDLAGLDLPSPWVVPQDDARDDQALGAAPDDARALTAGALPEAPVSPAVPEDLTAVSRTAAVVWAHVTLGSNVPAPQIVSWLSGQGVEVSESLVYKVRRSAKALGADVSAMVEGSGEYPVLALSASEDSPSE